MYLKWQAFLEHNLDYDGTSDAYKMAFKALEQMDVLDKIRAEIAEHYARSNYESEKYGRTMTGLKIALDVIDKYTAQESEVNKCIK